MPGCETARDLQHSPPRSSSRSVGRPWSRSPPDAGQLKPAHVGVGKLPARRAVPVAALEAQRVGAELEPAGPAVPSGSFPGDGVGDSHGSILAVRGRVEPPWKRRTEYGGSAPMSPSRWRRHDAGMNSHAKGVAMKRKLFEYGGIAASVILIAVGLGSIGLGAWGFNEVRDNLAQENIVGTPDSSIPGQKVDTGSEARAFAAVMRKHALEATRGPDLRRDGQVPRRAGQRDERRGCSGQGSEDRPARRERGPEPLGHRDRSHHGADHGVHGRAAGDLRDGHGRRHCS